MTTEDSNFILNQVVELRKTHHTSLKIILRSLNIIIAIYHARNDVPADVRMRMVRKVAQLMSKIDRLEKINKKIVIRLHQLEKTFNAVTKGKSRNK